MTPAARPDAHTGTDEAAVDLAAELTAIVIPLGRALRATSADLTPTQRSVLGTVLRLQPVTMGRLAEEERLSPAMISRVVTALVERGFLDRVSDERDRRVCRVLVTGAGMAWIEDSRVRRNRWLADRLASLNPGEQDAVAAAVPVLARLVEQDGA